MFRIDLHVHTSRYSPCAESLKPEKLVTQAQKCHLDGMVITEHDRIWSPNDIYELQNRTTDVRFYRGVEVSSASGHFVVIGIDDLSGIEPGISIEGLINKIKPQGAALILVHHHLAYSNISAPRAVQDMPAEITAIEVASSVTFGQHQHDAEEIAEHRGWTAVGGSDAHHIDTVGSAFTNFTCLPQNERQLAETIQAGDCSAGRQHSNP